ncbi:dTDP-glucose 4,6-dehydratase [Paucisalibacillus sp. EB02]|uniref:dTDP-glucose 4,6-dehydratase n=1 Tax=Paucisalibacillus sp. EB02 TaxID=1347087 RepID=UPI0004ADA408|nr:dTDP-glucose 4,6-dehydratase [Paucisalibacillus sp. EB02]
MNLLVTGGAGFIGSNFIPYMLEQHEDINIINLDKLTYAGSTDNLQEVRNHPRHTFIQGDICDEELLIRLFEEYQIEGVIHFAAESHVDNSIKNPKSFIETNVLGTYNLLNIAKGFWMDGIGSFKPELEHARFLHISTDEVYGTLGAKGFFTEETPYAPNSPYSASKASSDLLVRSYYHTYGMNVVTTNCSNNYGPKQHNEKLMPTIIRKALAFEKIPIYGDGQNVRDWLYVLDHCRAIEKVFFKGKSGETYLIGGHNERNNLEIAESICEKLNKMKPISVKGKGISTYKDLISFVEDRPGHDFRYAVDDSKLIKELGFEIKYSFDEAIEKTVSWYIRKNKDR